MITKERSLTATAKESAEPATESVWQPLLQGDAAKQALNIVVAIAQEVATNPLEIVSPAFNQGAAGRALFFAYLDEALTGPYSELAGRFLARAAELAGSVDCGCDFYNGTTGLAWVVEHIAGPPFEPGKPDAADGVDEALRGQLRAQSGMGNYDLISGLAGYAVYALERLPRPIAADTLRLIVERLAGGAVRRDDGITWLTSPELLPEETRQDYPKGYYNLGVAHGVPAVIAVLAAARAASVQTAQAHELYDGAVAWLMAQRLEPDSLSSFPYWVVDAEEPDPARAAWCYGDPGVAATLLAAARMVGDDALAQQALEIGRRAARRSIESSGVRDAGLCHGAAGLAHLFNRLWQATGEPLFAAAARTWFDEVFHWRQPGQGVAGYEAWTPDRALTIDPASFLNGAQGIGLALLAAITTNEPAWDRALMASLAPIE